MNLKAAQLIKTEDFKEAGGLDALIRNLESINSRILKIKSKTNHFHIKTDKYLLVDFDKLIEKEIKSESLKLQSDTENQEVLKILHQFKVSTNEDFLEKPTPSQVEEAIEKQLEHENQLFQQNETIQKSNPTLYAELNKNQIDRVKTLLLFYVLGHQQSEKRKDEQLAQLIQQIDEKIAKLEELKQKSPLLQACKGSFFNRANPQENTLVLIPGFKDPYSSFVEHCNPPLSFYALTRDFDEFSSIRQAIENQLATEKNRLEELHLKTEADRQEQQISALLHQFQVSHTVRGQPYLQYATDQIQTDIEGQLTQEDRLFVENEKIRESNPTLYGEIRQKQETRVRMLTLFYALGCEKGLLSKSGMDSVEQLSQLAQQTDKNLVRLEELKRNSRLLQTDISTFFEHEGVRSNREKTDAYASFMAACQQLLRLPSSGPSPLSSLETSLGSFSRLYQSIKNQPAIEEERLVKESLAAQSDEGDDYVSTLLHQFKISRLTGGEFPYLQLETDDVFPSIIKRLEQENQLYLQNETIKKSDPVFYSSIRYKQEARVSILLLFYALGYEQNRSTQQAESNLAEHLTQLMQQVEERVDKLEKLRKNSPLLQAYAKSFFDFSSPEEVSYDDALFSPPPEQDLASDAYALFMLHYQDLLNTPSINFQPIEVRQFLNNLDPFPFIYQSIQDKVIGEGLKVHSHERAQQTSSLLHQFEVPNDATENLYLQPKADDIYLSIEDQFKQENQLYLENEKIKQSSFSLYNEIRQKQEIRVRMLMLFYALSHQEGQVAKGRGTEVDQLIQFTHQVDAQIRKLDQLRQDNPLLQAYSGAFFNRESPKQKIYDVTEKLVYRPDQDVNQDLYTSFVKESQQFLTSSMATEDPPSFRAIVDKFFTS